MKKSLFLLILPFLVVGCGSGGSSSGSGAGTVLTDNGLRLSLRLAPDDSPNVNAYSMLSCVDADGMPEDITRLLMDTSDTLTLEVRDVGDLTGGLFERGIKLIDYTISYLGSGPPLNPVSRNDVARDVEPGTETISLTLITIAQLDEYTTEKLNSIPPSPRNPPDEYSIRVSLRYEDINDRDDNGIISASTRVSIGAFCPP